MDQHERRRAPRRRDLLGWGAAGLGAAGVGVVAGCSGEVPSEVTRTKGATAPPSPSSPGHDPDWVRVENAKTGDEGWRVYSPKVAGDDLVGFASAASVRPGEAVEVYLRSDRGPVDLTVYRAGHYGGAGGRLVDEARNITAPTQPEPTSDDLGTVRCDWQSAHTLDTTDWPEGTYLVRLEARGRAKSIPLTLRSHDLTDRLVIVNATTTYQAYNEWGGASLYHGLDAAGERTFGGRARAVSFERPYDGNGVSILMKYEHAPIRLAEELGLDLAYLTSGDLEEADLTGAAGVVSLGHDEYWSVPMRDAVEAARDHGTNLAFLGANACYWRVRLTDAGRTVVCHKSADLDPADGPTTTALWRGAPHPRPENSLTGMLYEAFPAVGPLVVHDPDSWLLEGTGATKGASYPGLVGSEIDRVYPIDGTPSTLQVIGHSPTPLAGGRSTHANFTYYTSDSGAGVVSTGTMSWCYGIRGEYPELNITTESVEFARAVSTNLLTAMAAGPLGRTHRSVPNLDGLTLPVTTATGTGGAVADHP